MIGVWGISMASGSDRKHCGLGRLKTQAMQDTRASRCPAGRHKASSDKRAVSKNLDHPAPDTVLLLKANYKRTAKHACKLECCQEVVLCEK